MASWTIGPAGFSTAERRSGLVAHGPILEVIIHREEGAEVVEDISQYFESRAIVDTGASLAGFLMTYDGPEGRCHFTRRIAGELMPPDDE